MVSKGPRIVPTYPNKHDDGPDRISFGRQGSHVQIMSLRPLFPAFSDISGTVTLGAIVPGVPHRIRKAAGAA